MSSPQPESEISALLDRYLLGLDENRVDDAWLRTIFTPDARVEFPVGHHDGIDGLAGYHRAALDKFAGSQHLSSPCVVDRDGDQAVVRSNLLTTHVHRPNGSERPRLFSAGTFVHGEARRTSGGWRLRRLSFRLVWSTGSPP